MKTRNSQSPFLAVGLAAALTLAVGSALAQDSNSAQNPGTSQAAPELSSVASQVIQLSRANIGEDTIITFVQNSGNGYSLDAAQIIYLKQQGVSANVINAMIKQFNRPVGSTPVVTPPNSQVSYRQVTPQSEATLVATPPNSQVSYRSYTIAQSPKGAATSPNSQTNCIMMQPVVTTVQTAPTYYYYPYYPYYYPYYGYVWPPVALSFGFGWGGGGFHGGFRR